MTDEIHNAKGRSPAIDGSTASGAVTNDGHPLDSLKVMTYNIQGFGALFSGRYLERVASIINLVSPDVVGLQEVHRRSLTSRFRDQAEELAGLTGMSAHFAASGDFKSGEHGNAVLSRGSVIDSAVHVLPGKAERRTLLETKIDLGGGVLDFFVTHLAAFGPLTRSARDRQVRYITEHLETTDSPYVLVGDFNAPPSAPEMRELLRGGHEGPRRTHSTHRLTRQRLDYIVTESRWQTTETQVLRQGPSDHFPVVAQLHLPNQHRESTPDSEIPPIDHDVRSSEN